MKLKICGITNFVDYREAVFGGADYIGFIFYPPSPRSLTPEQAEIVLALGPREPHFKVGVFVDEDPGKVKEISRRLGLHRVQLHGDESPDYLRELGLPCWKAIRVKDERSLDDLACYDCDAFLLDTYREGRRGGTGVSFDPSLLERACALGKPVVAAGGISHFNLETYFQLPHPPFAIDVSSSLEESPGRKSREKMMQFFQKYRKLKDKYHEQTNAG